jgi:competence ComEA-like helix-hairpin-helix protein
MLPFIVAAAGLSIGKASGQEVQKDAGIFRAVCGSCHSTSLVEGLRTESEWREEVDQMIKIGARGTDEQLQAVMRFLIRTLTKVNVNTAEAPEIARVLDVPDRVAEAMVKHRISNGAFKTLQDLKLRSGIDPAKLEALKERLLY